MIIEALLAVSLHLESSVHEVRASVRYYKRVKRQTNPPAPWPEESGFTVIFEGASFDERWQAREKSDFNERWNSFSK